MRASTSSLARRSNSAAKITTLVVPSPTSWSCSSASSTRICPGQPRGAAAGGRGQRRRGATGAGSGGPPWGLGEQRQAAAAGGGGARRALAAGCSTSSSFRMVAPSLVIVTSPMSSTSICAAAGGEGSRGARAVWEQGGESGDVGAGRRGRRGRRSRRRPVWRCPGAAARHAGSPARLVQAHGAQAGLQDVGHRQHRRRILRAHVLPARALPRQLQLRPRRHRHAAAALPPRWAAPPLLRSRGQGLRVAVGSGAAGGRRQTSGGKRAAAGGGWAAGTAAGPAPLLGRPPAAAGRSGQLPGGVGEAGEVNQRAASQSAAPAWPPLTLPPADVGRSRVARSGEARGGAGAGAAGGGAGGWLALGAAIADDCGGGGRVPGPDGGCGLVPALAPWQPDGRPFNRAPPAPPNTASRPRSTVTCKSRGQRLPRRTLHKPHGGRPPHSSLLMPPWPRPHPWAAVGSSRARAQGRRRRASGARLPQRLASVARERRSVAGCALCSRPPRCRPGIVLFSLPPALQRGVWVWQAAGCGLRSRGRVTPRHTA